MALRFVTFSQGELLGDPRFPEAHAGVCFAAADFWLESIQTDPGCSAAERIDDLRRMSSLIATRQTIAKQSADDARAEARSGDAGDGRTWRQRTMRRAGLYYDEEPTEVMLRPGSARARPVDVQICQILIDNPGGVMMSLAMAGGGRHAIAGYRHGANTFHFFDPNYGEGVADSAFDLHAGVQHLVLGALHNFYRNVTAVRPLPRNL
ncbi:MAG: YopT-type cysteine protease domain-containing protein [Pseudomonadota bacterium]